MFKFSLLPLDAVEPWGTPPDLALHWFGLTDGSYFIDLGDVHLLEYSQEWGLKPVEYQVVRLHEDLLDVLPSVLSPVPDEVANTLNQSSLPACFSILRRRDEELVRTTNDEVRLMRSAEAIQTLETRRLDTFYLNPGADIWIWRTGETIRFEWDNRDRLFNGEPAWSAKVGSHDVCVSDFLAAIHRFHNDLMDQMRVRVQQIKDGWHRDGVSIDVEYLVAEQAQREKALEMALARSAPPEYWDIVGDELMRA